MEIRPGRLAEKLDHIQRQVTRDYQIKAGGMSTANTVTNAREAADSVRLADDLMAGDGPEPGDRWPPLRKPAVPGGLRVEAVRAKAVRVKADRVKAVRRAQNTVSPRLRTADNSRLHELRQSSTPNGVVGEGSIS